MQTLQICSSHSDIRIRIDGAFFFISFASMRIYSNARMNCRALTYEYTIYAFTQCMLLWHRWQSTASVWEEGRRKSDESGLSSTSMYEWSVMMSRLLLHRIWMQRNTPYRRQNFQRWSVCVPVYLDSEAGERVRCAVRTHYDVLLKSDECAMHNGLRDRALG